MSRFIKVLAAAALMVVLTATTVSPAFAGGWHWGNYYPQYDPGGEGNGLQRDDGQPVTTGKKGIGWAAGKKEE